MKKGMRKRLLALGAGILMLIGSVPAMAASAKEITEASVQKADDAYYASLKDKDGGNLTGPSLTITKYISSGTDINAADTARPIQGVTFQYVKVGDLYDVTDGTEKCMAYGVTGTFAAAAGLTGTADYVTGSGDNAVYYFKDPDTINEKLREKTKADLETFLKNNNATEETTNNQGIIEDKSVAYGLYLIVEYSTAGAYDVENEEYISITKTQRPFVVALPSSMENDSGAYWEENVTVQVKNSTGKADTEKKIITNAVGSTLTPSTDEAVDTDTVAIGDTVWFRLKGTIPAIPLTSDEKITEYVLTDWLSAGLKPTTNGIRSVTVGGKNSIMLTKGTDFIVVISAKPISSSNGAFGEYDKGSEITFTFTETGLSKLTAWAKDEGNDDRAVYIYYSATVEQNATVGPEGSNNPDDSGNPNQVKLTYKIGSSSEITTDWDKVTVYTFGINLTKKLGDSESLTDTQKNAIEFVLYKEEQNNNKTYYKLAEINGIYYMSEPVATEEAATVLHPQNDGLISIRGLDASENGSSYYLKETGTVSGYHILKEPVKITLTAETGSNAYVADGDSTLDNYTGTVESDDDNGVVQLKVINTKGFTLPATGGAGIWLFVICGALVIGAGCIYFTATRKKYEDK